MRRISELRRRLAEDSGSIIVEYVWLAILMLVPLVYLVLCVARVQAGSYAVSQAARESSRVFIASDDGATAGTRAQAAAAIREAFPGAPVDILCVDPIRNVFDGGPDSGGENDNSAMMLIYWY